ncbi:MAG: hypothetical protein N2Z74_02430 [Syntrophales bacterium]|nr:hypothetical protein [Syntrophales bacterium]
MEEKAPLPVRTYAEINENRRFLMAEAYADYPEYVYCDPERFNWHTPEGRAEIFDLFYLSDGGLVTIIVSSEGRRRPHFYTLTSQGIDLLEVPGRLDERFPLSGY